VYVLTFELHPNNVKMTQYTKYFGLKSFI